MKFRFFFLVFSRGTLGKILKTLCNKKITIKSYYSIFTVIILSCVCCTINCFYTKKKKNLIYSFPVERAMKQMAGSQHKEILRIHITMKSCRLIKHYSQQHVILIKHVVYCQRLKKLSFYKETSKARDFINCFNTETATFLGKIYSFISFAS